VCTCVTKYTDNHSFRALQNEYSIKVDIFLLNLHQEIKAYKEFMKISEILVSVPCKEDLIAIGSHFPI